MCIIPEGYSFISHSVKGKIKPHSRWKCRLKSIKLLHYRKKYDCHAKMWICAFVSEIKNKDFTVYCHEDDLVTQLSLHCTVSVLEWKQQTHHLEMWMASSTFLFVYPGLTSQTTPSLHCLPTPLVTMPSHVITCPGRRTLRHLWSMNTTALTSTTRE